MYKLIIALLFLGSIYRCNAQETANKPKYLTSKLSIEPAIGTRFNTLLGNKSVQLSNLVQYNIQKSIGLVSLSTLTSNFKLARATDVIQNYNYSISQKFGIGPSVNVGKATHSFYMLAGLKYNAYSGTLANDQFVERETIKTNSVTSDYGILYNLKVGRKKYYYSNRVYVPVKDGLFGIIENASIEFGLGIQLD